MQKIHINIINFFFTLYLCVMSYYLYTHQYYNVDMEAYMGLVYKTEYPDMKIEEIHKKVYDELREKRPELFHFDLSHKELAKGENTYYKVLSENPKAYEEELQLFSVKPFYNFINFLFFKTGLEASTSTFLISIISYVLILILIFRYLVKILENHYFAVILALLFSLFKPLLEASRHASPDTLSCFLLLASIYVYSVKKFFFCATIFAMLCILTRPDYFVFYTLLYIFLYFYKKNNVKKIEFFLSYLYLFFSFYIIQYFNKISWSTLFMNQFTKVQIYPVSNPDVFQFSDYINFIKSKFLIEFNSSYFPLLLIFIVIILGYKFSLKNKLNLKLCLFFGIIYSSVFIRFLIFPTLVNRMMIGFYLIIILSLIYIQNSKKDFFKKTS